VLARLGGVEVEATTATPSMLALVALILPSTCCSVCLDFALTLIAEIAGEQHAKTMALLLEYDPQPPFNTGNHNLVGEELKLQVQGMVDHIAKELFLPLHESINN